MVLLFVSAIVFADELGLRKIGSSHGDLIGEKTGASSQQIIAPVSGQNILIRSIIFSTTAACDMYFYQDTAITAYDEVASSKYVTSPIPFAAKGATTPDYVQNKLLEKGNGLYMWTSADPNTGWYEIIFDLVNESATDYK